MGSGSLGWMQRSIDPLTLAGVLLSHLHADHCLDLCGFYVMRKYHPRGAQPKLPVWGPKDTARRMTAEFLAYSQTMGNDLSTPRPDLGFPGLRPGDRWCVCAPRWKEALDAGAAPQVVLESTHEETLAIVPLGILKDYAVEA